MAERIANFDDWKDLFYKWQKDIGFDPALVKDYKFDAIYDEGTSPTIEFGEFKGRKKSKKPPPHENFDTTPAVYRWPYDYSVPNSPADWLAQNRSDAAAKATAR